MSTGFRGAYIRGVDSILRQDDGVDAGAVSDCLVNNVGHLYDSHHAHIANWTSLKGYATPMKVTPGLTTLPALLCRYPFRVIEAADGGSAKIVYRFKGYRINGSGDVDYVIRVASGAIRYPSSSGTVSWQATHTISATTATEATGSLYVPASHIDEVAPVGDPMWMGGPSAGPARLAWLELWAYTPDDATSEAAVESFHARQFWRAP